MLFSVIVPVFNVEKYLAQCVNSVLSQTCEDFELILVDDGSTDTSAEMCDGYAAADDRVHVLHKRNGGLSSARNAGIAAATGDYIIFLDADDYWVAPNLLEEISYVRNSSLVLWKMQRCAENETVSANPTFINKASYSLFADYKSLFKNGTLFASACYLAIPHGWFSDGTLLFKLGDTSEDVVWFGKLLHRIDYLTLLDYPFYAYRYREGSISNTVSKSAVNTLREHLLDLSAMASNAPSPVLLAYLAEQTANYIIVLSRSAPDVELLSAAKPLLHSLKAVLRPRSKIIRYSVSLFGIKGTVRLLQLMDRYM